jgi:hypothetical protein
MTAHPAEPVPDADPDEAAVAAAALREYREWVVKGRPDDELADSLLAQPPVSHVTPRCPLKLAAAPIVAP